MYSYITGIVKEIETSYIVLDNHGIGYLIYTANPYQFHEEEEVKIYLYQQVREDENTLYGFKTKEEKDLFLQLIQVKGLGCKMALPMLATGSIEGIQDAIERENVLYLKKFPKIGDKVARQIILDLKGKLAASSSGQKTVDQFEELVEVLKGLGYKQPDIKRILPQINSSLELEDTIKEALKLMLKSEVPMEEDRIVTGEKLSEDNFEQSIRPDRIDDYIGQGEVKENLEIFIKAAKMREEPLDHVLLYGPPGLGKTTLSYIIANELGSNIKTASGPSIEKSGDLAAILSTLEPGDVLFIDEIHRMPRFIEEILYPAMEDFTLDIIVGEGSTSRNIKINLPPFTLVGATTRAGDLSDPLRDRFGIISKLNYYTVEELTQIVKRTSRVLECSIDEDAAVELATRSRGTPRIANRLFRRVRDFALVMGNGNIDLEITKYALDKLKVDSLGLDNTDYNLLKSIIEKFNGGPVGIEAIASSIGEERGTIEDVYEPYLLQTGLLKRTSRGRMATRKAYEHLEIPYPEKGE